MPPYKEYRLNDVLTVNRNSYLFISFLVRQFLCYLYSILWPISFVKAKGFEKAVGVAIAAKKVLDKHRLISFIKTSGKTGIHIYVPCSGYTFMNTRRLAYQLADEVHKLVPKISTRQESKDLRGGNVYIDAGQNDYADTLASPYSIRPYHQPLVSTPLEWKEVKKGLDRYSFTMDTIKTQIYKKGDIWKKLTDEKIILANNKSISRL